MSRGRPAGATTPHHTPVSYSLQPDSATVGTFGRNGERLMVVTAERPHRAGLDLPDRFGEIVEG